MRSVGELMRHEFAVAPADASVRQIIALMVDMDMEGVLIADDRGRVIGSIADEQLVAGLHASRHRPWWRQLVVDADVASSEERLSGLPAAEVMLRRVVSVAPDAPASEAVRLFDDFALNVLPVVASRRRLVGALYRGDLIKRLLRPPLFGRPPGPEPG